MLQQTKKNPRLRTKLFLTLSLLLVAVLVMTGCGAGDTNDTTVEEPPVGVAPTEAIEEPSDEVVVQPTEAVEEPADEVAVQPTEAAEEPVTELEDAAEDTDELVATNEFAIRVSELTGYRVVNPQGEDLGEIEDVIVGLGSSPINYGVLSFGGFLDIGDKLFAIPLNAMTINTEEDTLVFDVAEETLESAPGFDDSTWPDLTTADWETEFRSFWETAGVSLPPAATDTEAMTAAGPAAVRASEITGDTILNSAGEDIGEVDDLLVSLNQQSGDAAAVNYAILSFGGFADIGDQLYAVPLHTLNITNPEEAAITFDVDETMLQAAPSFTDDAWPDVTNPAWDDNILNYWENAALAAAPGATDATGTTTEAMSEAALRASELMGYNVVNSQGEDLGEIEDLIVGLDSEQVRYAVLSFGGFLDIGDKLFAIPLTAMTLNSAEGNLVFDVAEETLENAPSSFDDNTWPDLTNPQWDTEIRNFWQDERLAITTDQAQEAAMVTEGTVTDEAAIRASELLDYNIRNSQGEDIGEVEDLIVGLNTGHINYAVLSFGGFADIGENFYFVPLSALNFDTINHEEQAFVFDVDETALQNAPSFDQNSWPDLTTPGWDAEFGNYWNSTDLGAASPVTAEMDQAAIEESAVRASELIGYNVVNSQGEDLGEIEDLLVNFTNGQVHYAVISFGGFAGLGENLYPVPLSALNVNTTDGTVVFDVDEQMLQNAPSFDDNTWPDMALPDWDRDIYDFWQTQGVTMPAAALTDETTVVDRSVMRVSEIIGANVVNSAGDDLGEIEDLMIGLDSQRVNYAVLSFGGFLDIGEKLFAIPVTALTFDADQEAVVFDVDEETLQNAPGFDTDNWPDTANPQWDLDSRDYWQDK